jgi:hypothetical protein
MPLTIIVESGITPPPFFILDNRIAVEGRGDPEEFISFHLGVEDCAVRLPQGNDALPCRSAMDRKGKNQGNEYEYAFLQKTVYLQTNCIFRHFL